MRRTFIFLAFLATLLTAWSPAPAADLPIFQDWLFFELPRAEGGEYPATDRLAVLLLRPQPGWYTYSDAKSPVGQPTSLHVELKDVGPLQVFMPPGQMKKDVVDRSLLVEVYQRPTPLFVPLPLEAKPPYRLQATLRLLLCTEDQCLPTSLDLPTDSGPGPFPPPSKDSWWSFWPRALERGPAAPTALKPTTVQVTSPCAHHWSFTPSYLQAQLEVSTLPPAIFFGLLAGFLLNFMPCVLPVVSLKISALLRGTAYDHLPCQDQFRKHNLFFALGVLAYFLFLSLLLGGTGQAWGQTFQKPEVVLALVTILFSLSLSLFGIYTLPILDMKFGQSTRPRTQAFFTGVLATLLASPCSGPLLGGVLGWALLQPPAVISAVFLSIGLGMAAPYLILVANPSLVRFLPKFGPWVSHLEKGIAFLLMGTCIYLLNILPEGLLVAALILLWITALATWLLGQASRVDGRGNAISLRTLALALVVAAFVWAMRPRTETIWTEFQAANFAESLGKETLFVEFTADWCPSCKVLNQAVFNQENISTWSEHYDLTLVRVDLSQPNPDGEALLQALGSRSIPVLAVFPARDPDKPLVLRDFYSSRDIREALDTSLRP